MFARFIPKGGDIVDGVWSHYNGVWELASSGDMGWNPMILTFVWSKYQIWFIMKVLEI